MVSNKYQLIFILLIQTSSLIAQININFDSDCVTKNGMIITRAILELKDETIITPFLEDKTDYLFLINVDSLGYVVNIERVRSKKEFPLILVKEIETFLTQNRIKFYMCFDLPDDTSKEYMYKIITQNLFEDKDTYIVNASFPGLLMSYYNMDEKNRKKMDRPLLSKYNFLKEYIDEYLHSGSE